MKLFIMILMLVCASIMFLLSIIMFARKGKAFKYKAGMTDEQKEKARKQALNMFIFVFVQSIAIFVLAFGIYFKLVYLYAIAAVMTIPIIVWAIKTLMKK